MKKIKYILSVIIVVSCLSFASCGTMGLGSKLKKVEIGMTKSEVTNILGNNYDVMAARDTPDGTIETFRYESVTIDGPVPYIVSFLNGRLIEWFREPGY